MHIGGLHIFAGLFYLVVCAAITACWLKMFYMLWVLFFKGIHKIRHKSAQNKWIAGQGRNPDEILNNPKLPIFNVRFFLAAALLSLAFSVIIYTYQRSFWMGGDNTHYKAKEYWVAGQVVYGHRLLLGRMLHPDNPIIYPYTVLQRYIYGRGVTYLPITDAERYVWENSWFYYPYARNTVRPFGVGIKKYEPKMVQLLDKCWEAMRALMEKEISDPQMNKKNLLSFPFLLSYYSSFQGYYTGPFWLSGRRTWPQKKYSARNVQMLEWCDTLYARWVENGYLEEIWNKYPYVAGFRQHSVNRLTQGIALSLPLAGTFTCDHPIMKRMLKEFQISMSGDPAVNSIINLSKKDRKQARLTYQSAVYGSVASAGNYLLSDVCGVEMPQELYLLVEKIDIYNEFESADTIEHVFRYELKPLIRGEIDHVQ